MKNHCHDIYLEETPLMSVTGHHWYKNDQTNILSRVSLLMWQSWTDPLILKVGSKFYYKIKRGQLTLIIHTPLYTWKVYQFCHLYIVDEK